MSRGTSASRLQTLGIKFLERGWLSANNTVITGDGPSAVVDTGYASHALQSVQLIQHALDGRTLDLIVNTHLHSDHCGGNAILQSHYPAVATFIPPGHWNAVAQWDTHVLTYAPTGQECQRFAANQRLLAGTTIRLGSFEWEIHAAPGHDPHSVILFQSDHRVLISADALWENGFGVVFPELEGVEAFHEVSQTLDIIEGLAPELVIPGHGPVFTDVEHALKRARTRLAQFESNPDQHLRYALKVLIKYRLLALQQIRFQDLLKWACSTPYLAVHMPDEDESEARALWLRALLSDLERSSALTLQGDMVINC